MGMVPDSKTPLPKSRNQRAIFSLQIYNSRKLFSFNRQSALDGTNSFGFHAKPTTPTSARISTTNLVHPANLVVGRCLSSTYRRVAAKKSGRVAPTLEVTWNAIHLALLRGMCGLPGGSSLAQLLLKKRQVPLPASCAPLSEELILKWADEHFARTGQWPNQHSGPVFSTPELSWKSICIAFYLGSRGLPKNSSLARLLAKERSDHNPDDRPRLTLKQILAWADAHYRREGKWPTSVDGVIEGVPGETWEGIDRALAKGLRGLKGNYSLTRLLAKYRGVRSGPALSRLEIPFIIQWAKAHREQFGRWPKQDSGEVVVAPGETWLGINGSLREGRRGLPGGTTLHQVLLAYEQAQASKEVRSRQGNQKKC
jgi:hypothetical protein